MPPFATMSAFRTSSRSFPQTGFAAFEGRYSSAIEGLVFCCAGIEKDQRIVVR
ncbi:MAG: hypothetical protein PHQ34_03295 [Methanothrix sp.]|nr:hypothetical protein [Methanothrix sp.]